MNLQFLQDETNIKLRNLSFDRRRTSILWLWWDRDGQYSAGLKKEEFTKDSSWW